MERGVRTDERAARELLPSFAERGERESAAARARSGENRLTSWLFFFFRYTMLLMTMRPPSYHLHDSLTPLLAPTSLLL